MSSLSKQCLSLTSHNEFFGKWMSENMISCPSCGWEGSASQLRRREGESKVSDGFLLWLDMRRERRYDYLCPNCGKVLRSKASIYGYEDTVFSD